MTVLVVGIILIGLLVGISLLQRLLKQRQAANERALPHVAALQSLVLTDAEFPTDYHVHYRGPLTNERLALSTADENATLDELDELGRVIGYRQAFRDPRSYGELIDVPLNLTIRSSKQQRMITLDFSLFEDSQGAAEFIGEDPPSSDDDESGATIRVSAVGSHALDFAESVRQWSRLANGDEMQRKIEVRWRNGRLGARCRPRRRSPGGIEAREICDLAQRVQDRLAGSPLAQEGAAEAAGGTASV